MLSYPIDEAESLLDSKFKAAKLSLSNCEEDLDFLREQITVRRRLAFLGLGTEALLTTPSADRPWRWRSHESTTGMWCTSAKRRRKRRRAKERARLVPRRAESRARGANAPKLVLDIIQSGLTIKTHPTPLCPTVQGRGVLDVRGLKAVLGWNLYLRDRRGPYVITPGCRSTDLASGRRQAR